MRKMLATALILFLLLGCARPPGSGQANSTTSPASGLPAPEGNISAQPNPVSPSSLSGARISINYSDEKGEISPFLAGTNAGPYFDPQAFNLSGEAGFKVLEVFIQIEDSPVPANPEDPSQYNFTLSDRQISAIVAAGAEPMLAFGPLHKPANVSKYAIYAANVARHYTQGWGNGYHYNVRLYRFANEPDGKFWEGTEEELFQTYAAWARALKQVDGSFILDAPGIASIYTLQASPRGLRNTHEENKWARDFLDYCRDNSVPLDVFSFHVYDASPYEFGNSSALASSIVADYPNVSPLYGTPRIGNDEWNIMVGDLWSGKHRDEFDTTWVAAHNIAALINMAENGLFLSIRYGGTFNGNGSGCHDFPIVCGGQGKPAYYALKAFNSLAGKRMLAANGTDGMNFAAIAGKGDDGSLAIVFSNFDLSGYASKYPGPGASAYADYSSKFGAPKTYDSFNAAIGGLPWNVSDTLVYEHYLVDGSHNLALVENRTISGNSSLSFGGEMVAPSVHMIIIRKE